MVESQSPSTGSVVSSSCTEILRVGCIRFVTLRDLLFILSVSALLFSVDLRKLSLETVLPVNEEEEEEEYSAWSPSDLLC